MTTANTTTTERRAIIASELSMLAGLIEQLETERRTIVAMVERGGARELAVYHLELMRVSIRVQRSIDALGDAIDELARV